MSHLYTAGPLTEQHWRGARSPQQAAVLAVRQGGAEIEVCLIRRRDAGAWSIPKGFIESGDSHEETALNEAWEEAGIRGQLVGEAIGTYEYAKLGTRLTVAVYVMRVVEELAVWPEMRLRQRKWAPIGEAASMLTRHPVRPLLDHVSVRLGTGAG
jgi:8-oxo-dGTP pyrophosphatase MutT (NUDIX family)